MNFIDNMQNQNIDYMVRYYRKYLAMGKPFKMIEGMMPTDSFWS